MHLAHRIKSIERFMPREQSRNQHPNCAECKQPAAFTLEINTGSGTGLRDLWKEDLRKELIKEPELAAGILIAFLEQQLPAVKSPIRSQSAPENRQVS